MSTITQMSKMLVAVAVALAAIGSVAEARSLKLEQDGLVAWVPDAWNVESRGGAFVAVAPSTAATAMFHSEPIRDLDLAYKGLPKLLSATLPSIQFGTPKRRTVAGLNAIEISGIADVRSDAGTTKIEAHILIVSTPTQRALYIITMVSADQAKTFDPVIEKIFSGITKSAAEPVDSRQPAPKKENPCWEMAGHPNGWSRGQWAGVTFLLPRGWTKTVAKNPDADVEYATIANGADSIFLFEFGAGSADAAWKAFAGQAAGYQLGDVSRGEVAGQAALCARGSASDGVVFQRGGKALGMLAKSGGDPSAMRGILGSIRWK